MPIPSEPVYGYADKDAGSASYRGDRAGSVYPAAGAAYTEASVKSEPLAPVGGNGPVSIAPASQRYASNDTVLPDAGGTYAMQPIDAHGGSSAAPIASAPGQRYAESSPGYYRGRSSGGSRYDSRSYADEPAGKYARDGGGHDAGGHGDDYVVVPGDTLYSIAQRHGISTVELAELNALTGSTIIPGQRLRVRGGGGYAPAEKTHTSAYEPRHEDSRDSRYSEDDRKAPPPGYGSDDRYSSYSNYGKSQAKPHYGRGGDDESHYSRGPRAPSRQSGYAEPPYRSGKAYDEEKSHKPYYADRAYRSPKYDEPDEGKAPPPQRHAYADDERDEPPHRGRAAKSYEPRDDERRYSARPSKPKGSYQSYSVKRGESLAEIARRNGISHRELAELNDIPPSARLYPGQVLRLPHGAGAEEDDRPDAEDGYLPPSERRGPRPHDDRYSKAAPKPEDRGGKGEGEGERRVAKADIPAQGNEPRANDASTVEAAPAQSPEDGARSVMAAHRDVGPAEAQSGGGQAAGGDCESLLANPSARSAQSFREPVQGVITAKFGSKPDGSFNDGIDFSVPKGTPVKAAENGVVAYAGNELPGFGNLVLVRHADGYVTAYAHNEEILVKRCEVVKRGQVITKAGATGKATQPQLHFELRKDSKPVDPEGFFSRS